LVTDLVRGNPEAPETAAAPTPGRPAKTPPVVAVVGLGYVGLPLAMEFGRQLQTIGYDIDPGVVARLRGGDFPSDQVPTADRRKVQEPRFTDDAAQLATADFVIVAVPTPIVAANRPDLRPLKLASQLVGRHLKRGATVIYESTVYPGATEEICIPELEQSSGMRWREDFHVGYSPERSSPGDPAHDLRNVKKIIAGDSGPTADQLSGLYGRIVTAGVHRATSIKVAEAAKVLENTQRDLNIALVNEVAIIFRRLGIDTAEVLAAAATKWNFLAFEPGLVGGHCIGVDPYYLTFKAQTLGVEPEVILAGRKVNDSMGRYIARETIKELVRLRGPLSRTHVNVLGITFKENCDDARNSRVVDLVRELGDLGVSVAVHDPRANADWVRAEYGVELVAWEALPRADCLVLAVPHDEFLDLPLPDLTARLVPGGLIVDVKSRLPRDAMSAAGLHYWRL
jgi:UDP-N-acetyl-D-galactosamine dehydrogenase